MRFRVEGALLLFSAPVLNYAMVTHHRYPCEAFILDAAAQHVGKL
jgi:hypothetical protein